MKGFFDSVGIHVEVWDMALWGIPTAITALIVSWFRFNRLDRRIAKAAGKNGSLNNLAKTNKDEEVM